MADSQEDYVKALEDLQLVNVNIPYPDFQS